MVGQERRTPARRSRGLGASLAAVIGVTYLLAGPTNPASAATAPLGHLDGVSATVGGAVVDGWALDPDTTAPISVDIYSDSRYLTRLTANVSRPDVGSVYPGYGSQHGFSTTVSLASGVHTICAYAINVPAPAVNPLLGCLRVRLVAPFGNVDQVAQVPGGTTVSGWVIDPTTTGPISVDIAVDGAIFTRTVGNVPRPDLAPYYPGMGTAHGFTALVAVPQGPHTVCVYAAPAGTGTAGSQVGCRTVNPNYDPVGSVDAIARTPAGLVISGWGADPDTQGPVTADVTVDGALATQTSANEPRPDVGSAHPSFGNNRGYAATVNPAQGTHRICVNLMNIGPGSTANLYCASESTNHAPFGNVEAVSEVAGGARLVGWALDQDTAGPVAVQISADGNVVSQTTANVPRPDIADAFPGYGAGHGFDTNITLGEGTHTLCATAVSQGSRTAILCQVVTLRFSPFGQIDLAARAGATSNLTVSGWAIDPETTQPINVRVTIDGAVAGVLAANQSRPDVAAVYPASGQNHGYSHAFDANDGEHEVCVDAVNVNTGTDTVLGCKVLNAVDPVVSTAPRNVVAVGGYGAATVSWTAPASDGGAPPTFTVTASPGGRTATATVGATGAFVGGLSPSTTYAFSVVATNVAGRSAAGVSNHVTTQALPPAQTTAAPVSTSRYIRNISGAAGDPATLRAEGVADAAANPSGHGYVILLDIGGQTQSGSGGVLLSAITRYVSYADLVSSLNAYVDGYASAQKPSAPVIIALGTNNDSTVSATTGAVWATAVVNPVAAHSTGYPNVTIAGADDIEPGFSASVASSRAWLSGYLGATSAPFVFNGSADGCSWTAINGACNNTWTAADLYWLSGGAASGRIISLPQIYNNTMAKQWKYISLTGVASGQQRIYFGGSLTELTACQQAGSCGSLSGNDAWNSLWGQLNSDARLAPGTLPYSTDLRIN